MGRERRSRADRFVPCETGIGRKRHRILDKYDFKPVVTLLRPPSRTLRHHQARPLDHWLRPIGLDRKEQSKYFLSVTELILLTASASTWITNRPLLLFHIHHVPRRFPSFFLLSHRALSDGEGPRRSKATAIGSSYVPWPCRFDK